MESNRKTVIVTGASQGIGAGVTRAFLARGYNVVANARTATKSKELPASPQLALVDGDIGEFETAHHLADAALKNSVPSTPWSPMPGIFSAKPFTAYTPDDLRSLVATNVAGFIYVAQLAVKQMHRQKSGGSVVGITAALATIRSRPSGFHPDDYQRWTERVVA